MAYQIFCNHFKINDLACYGVSGLGNLFSLGDNRLPRVWVVDLGGCLCQFALLATCREKRLKSDTLAL